MMTTAVSRIPRRRDDDHGCSLKRVRQAVQYLINIEVQLS